MVALVTVVSVVVVVGMVAPANQVPATLKQKATRQESEETAASGFPVSMPPLLDGNAFLGEIWEQNQVIGRGNKQGIP